MNKEIFIIAGPNGAGKTTFARNFIPEIPSISQFINADLIAYGLSPFNPEKEAIQAGKLMIKQIDKCVSRSESFCIETTLSGKNYISKINEWKKLGYTVTLIFLQLSNVELAIQRVATRVKQGGHNIPKDVIERRFHAGIQNFNIYYKDIVNYWFLYNNDSLTTLIEQG